MNSFRSADITMKVFRGILLLCLSVLARAQSDGCAALDEIRDVQIRSTGNNLMVFWQEPINIITCGFSNVKHNVTYEGYSGIQEIETEDYFVFFDYDPYTCVPGIITITVIADNAEPVEHREEYYTETIAIESLSIRQSKSSIVASWAIPTEGTERCQFVYHVDYVDQDGAQHHYETTELEYELGVSLGSCLQASLTVTPYQANVYKGISASAAYEGAIDVVRNYDLKTALGQIVANFDPPIGIEHCEITYEIREIETEDCFIKEVSVAAYNGRIYSEWTTGVVEVEVNPVENLQASIGDGTIELSWTEPKSASQCSITYDVNVDGYQFVATGSGASIPGRALTSCQSANVTVSPISASGKFGIPARVEITPELAAVEDLVLSLESGVIVASWDAPAGSEDCVLSYLLEYANENGNHWYLTENNSYTFEYGACVDVSLAVVAHGADGSEGIRISVALPVAVDCVAAS